MVRQVATGIGWIGPLFFFFFFFWKNMKSSFLGINLYTN